MMTAYNINELIEIVNREIASLPYPSRPQGLYEPIKYTMEAGGKRIRPVLCLATLQAVGGDIRMGLKTALGIEMFHNFTLLHDDIMDRAEVRRGRSTVHCKWNDNTAILSGDTMLTLATQWVSSVSREHLPEILDVFNRTAIEIYEGQQYDIDFENRDDVTVDEYIEMIRLKTSVLLGCACRCGAIIGGASASVADAFYDYGINLGLAFQLQDDMLDTFGDSATFGKKIGGDILCDKKTWLLISAAAEDTSGIILRALSGEFSEDEKISKVRDVYRVLGLDKRIKDLIADYTDKALADLNRTGIAEGEKEIFVNLAHTLVNRNH